MSEQGETGEAITILLVEDDAPTCWRLQDALVKAGYKVRSAGTLGEARAGPERRRAARAADRSAAARRPWHRADPRDQAALSRHRDHGDLGARRRGERDLGDHRRRHRLSPEGRVPDRHRHHRARSGRRPFADLGLDRPLHRAQNARRRAEFGRAAAGSRAQHRTGSPRARSISSGASQRVSATPRSRAISACPGRPCPATSRTSIASSKCTRAAKRCSRRCSRA